jgi:hypothetical protein
LARRHEAERRAGRAFKPRLMSPTRPSSILFSQGWFTPPLPDVHAHRGKHSKYLLALPRSLTPVNSGEVRRRVFFLACMQRHERPLVDRIRGCGNRPTACELRRCSLERY